MIDLSIVRDILNECSQIVEELDGQDLDETTAVAETSNRSRSRQERARMSQRLQFLSSRLDLASGLVRNEYWVARGESDPLTDYRPEEKD